MIQALLRRALSKRSTRTGYAAGGYVGPASNYQPAGYLHHGEYIYRDADGTVWHVQQHPDGDTRTQLTQDDLLEGDDE